MRRVAIYALRDPLTDHVRYVGSAVDPKKRLSEHKADARRYPDHPSLRWIQTTLAHGGPRMQIIEITDLSRRVERERFWTWELTAVGAPLTNRHAHMYCPIAADGRALCRCKEAA